MGTFRERFDRLLAGRPSDDPLQVSNRSAGQRAGLAFLIGLPFLLVIAVIVLVMPGKPPTVEHDVLSSEQIAERMLPGIDKMKVETNRDVEVTEAHVEKTGAAVAIAGSVRNNTNHAISGVEINLQVADEDGSILGILSQRFEKLAPASTAKFRTAVPYKTAYIVIVRDVKTP